MEVFNNTSFGLIAFCWHIEYGYGDDVEINPGESAHVRGPYLGEMGGGDCHILVSGKITCQETPDDDNGFLVAAGSQLNLRSGKVGVTVRHLSENRIIGKQP